MTPGPSPTRRRVLAAAGALLLPRAARAQTAKRRRIAFLATGSPPAADPNLGAFRQGLRALGYGDEDIEIEIRYADGHLERLPDLAAELVRLAPEVIVAAAPPAVQAAKQATSTIPIVMVASGDPVGPGSSPASRTRAATSPACPRSRRRWRGSGCSCSRPQFPAPSASPSCSTPATPRTSPCCRSRSRRPEPCAWNSSRSKPALPTRSTAPSPR